MIASWNESIVRSLQQSFATRFGALCAVVYDGQAFDPDAYSEWVVHSVDGPRWTSGRAGYRTATVTVTASCFVKKSADVHRLDEIAGKAAYALDRADVRLYDYPAASPAAVGWARMREAETTRIDLYESMATGGAGEVPLQQAAVTADGIVEIRT